MRPVIGKEVGHRHFAGVGDGLAQPLTDQISRRLEFGEDARC
jgi:hypothetical protein